MTSPKSECYRLIQQIAVKRDPRCIVIGCGAPSTVGHHLFKRSRMATAFLPEAVRGLCHPCHLKAHASPAWFRALMISMIGDRYYELERLSNTVVKVDFKAKRDELRGILEKLKWIGSYVGVDPISYARMQKGAFCG